MKNKLCLSLIILFSIFSFTSCESYNKEIIDSTLIAPEYNYAYILLPNGECVEGEVQLYTIYRDQLRIKINDIIYLTDTTRSVLIKK